MPVTTENKMKVAPSTARSTEKNSWETPPNFRKSKETKFSCRLTSPKEKQKSSALWGKLPFFSSCFGNFRPSSSEVDQIVKLFDAGMTMARINLSHGTMKSNQKLINKFKEAKRLRPHKTCALMLETRGREVRISNFENSTQRIRSGSTVSILTDEFHKASTDT
jgi:hypothetical protein